MANNPKYILNGEHKGKNGLCRLAKKYARDFAIPENTNYYLEKDYRIAKRKYVINMLKRLGAYNSSS